MSDKNQEQMKKGHGASLILIVDDEIDLADTLRDILRKYGYGASVAYSGDEALNKVRAEQPAMVLLDIRMPKMNGVEALKAIKEIDDSIQVIMMTGYTDIGFARDSIRMGAYDYVKKPIDLEYLRKTIESKLGKP